MKNLKQGFKQFVKNNLPRVQNWKDFLDLKHFLIEKERQFAYPYDMTSIYNDWTELRLEHMVNMCKHFEEFLEPTIFFNRALEDIVLESPTEYHRLHSIENLQPEESWDD